MRSDLVERSSLHLYAQAAKYADLYLPKNSASRAALVLGTTVSLQLIAAAELVEQIFMAVINVVTLSKYDALIYLRKSALTFAKIAASPISTIGLPILYHNLVPKRDFQTKTSQAVIDTYKIYRNFFGGLANSCLPRPQINKERVLAAIDRECHNLKKLDSITEKLVQAKGDSLPIFITDEWHRYWGLDKWQKSDYSENTPIEVRQLTFAGWRHEGRPFALSLEQTKQLRDVLDS